MNIQKVIGSALAGLALAGCTTQVGPFGGIIRPDPLDTPITFGDSCKHYLLFKHDCRRSLDECRDVCKGVLEKFAENKVLNEERWKKFKAVNPNDYQFNPTGVILLDDINPILMKLAAQIKHEVVIPYIELDKDGMLSNYNQFMDDVKAVQGMNPNQDIRTAVAITYDLWVRDYGAENCNQLMAVFPIIRRLSTSEQLKSAFARNAGDLVRLSLRLNEGIEQLKAAKGWQDYARIVEASLPTFNALFNIKEAMMFLAVYQGENATLAEQAEAYLDEIRNSEGTN